jgi:hypothetical protein
LRQQQSASQMGVFIHINKTITDDSDNNNSPLHNSQ